MATYGAYAGAKFALEAVSDSLRREVAPLGVPVVVIQPGGVRTEIAARGVANANDLAAGMSPQQNERLWRLGAGEQRHDGVGNGVRGHHR